MQTLIEIIQVSLGVVMIVGILVQQRSSGLSSALGGGAGATVVQRRGAEKVIYKVTIWASVAFFALAVLRWYL